MRKARLPRALHPVAWWLWAVALATAAGRTGNPLLLLLIFGVLGVTVTLRRTDAPWARAFRYYLTAALVIIVIRVVFRSVFATGTAPGDHILFRLPHVPTPAWYAGIQLGGPVSLEAVLSAALDGLRLACLLCCVGAANSLANPKRALRVLPGALYELGVAVTVALSVAPQLVESVQRVVRARRLRAGRTSGLRALRAIAIPVLHDALDRSLRLAAAMDSRGYGGTGTATASSRRWTGLLLLTGLAGLCVGVYGLLDVTVPHAVGLAGFAAGALLCAGGLYLGGRRVSRTSYRPDPWQWPEWTVAAGGLCAAVVLAAGSGYDPTGGGALRWPTLPLVPALAVLLAAAAALASPPPPVRSAP
ncbi:energy-coupling factor transporter transmembrane component T [Hamadaea tsunoensis]|uniref:energy-coupling factor transporter transmembrane component T n=1 Tax=Hamadaea tsunoensis TaxID=53368 RepID=UPI0004102354|nr:energy-coupling factor transporter transmembrane component T [Hamadaea tsunoensis]